MTIAYADKLVSEASVPVSTRAIAISPSVAPPTPILTEAGGTRPDPDAQIRLLRVEPLGLSVTP